MAVQVFEESLFLVLSVRLASWLASTVLTVCGQSIPGVYIPNLPSLYVFGKVDLYSNFSLMHRLCSFDTFEEVEYNLFILLIAAVCNLEFSC